MKFNKSMVEYVITQWSINLTAKQRNNIERYANFLSQKLELWMFVACDENGNVLEEPKYPCHDSLYTEYDLALSKVIFEGFEYIEAYNENSEGELRSSDKKCRIIHYKGKIKGIVWGGDINTIEDLLKYNLDIKESIAKELGLI